MSYYEGFMAKKESKKPEKTNEKKGKSDKKDKKNKKGAANGVPVTGTPSTGVPPTGAQPGAIPNAGAASVPLSAMAPEQMTAAQLEQAIKESNDPESRLKKLRSPINVRSCLLNVLFLIILPRAVVVVWCAIAVDKFNFITVVKDMSDKFGITQGFRWLWTQISGWFH